MGVYKRGSRWWYKFTFQGQPIRESAHTTSKELAARAERERRRALELGANALEPVKKPLMFSIAAREWLAGNAQWSESSREIGRLKVKHLLPKFGGMVLGEISPQHISSYQRARQKQGASARTINMEVGALRQILRRHGRWEHLQAHVKMLREREDIGRALSADELHRIHAAAAASRSRSLPVALIVLENSGMRLSELRQMRWHQVDLLGRGLLVGKAKTKGSEGRFIPLNEPAHAALTAWRAQFPEAQPEHFLFPSERYGLDGDSGMRKGTPAVWSVDPSKPIGSWKTAWTTARRVAKVKCRTHDLRHTFVSRLAEGRVPDATLMALTGQLSRKMLERYSHTRVQAKRDAVQLLEHQDGVGTEVGTVN